MQMDGRKEGRENVGWTHKRKKKIVNIPVSIGLDLI